MIIPGGPEGIGYAMAAAVLLSERSALITGSTMFVDGGVRVFRCIRDPRY